MGKNYVESSLKRFLKRKVKITLGLVVAFMITGAVGYAEVIKEPIIITTEAEPVIKKIYDIQAKNIIGNQTYTIEVKNKGKLDINSEEITLQSFSSANFLFYS